MDNTDSQGGDPTPSGALSTSRRGALWGIVGIAVLLSGTLATSWWFRPTPPVAMSPEADLEEWDAPVAAAPGYLGVQACVPCHANRVAEFQTTRHFVACRAPGPGEMPRGFEPGKGIYQTRDPALQFELAQLGNESFQTTINKNGGAEKRTTTRIDLAYGSGGILDEVYFTWHGEKLYELPMVWLHPLNRWAMATYNPFGSGDFARDTTSRCLECHNTWIEHVPGTRNQYKRDSLILGVTCEKCHGPGREHVAFHQANPDVDTGRAVVNPGRLTRERHMEVCTQCHSNALHPRTQAFRYRPGEPLDAYYKTITTRYPEFDHVANQSTYVRQSKCFQKSDSLTCTSCHNPHRPHESVNASRPERSCLKCHKSADCAEQERLPVAVRGNCVGCHMPPRVWMNVHFHTEDDQYVPPIRRTQHRISVDLVARQEVLLAWYRTQADEASKEEAARLTKSLVAHWLTEAESRRREYRFLPLIGAFREAVRIDPSAATLGKLRQAVALQVHVDAELALGLHEIDERRFGAAVETLKKILAVKPNFAIAHGKIGTAYAASGRNELAVKHLQAVTEHDPNDPYGEMMLGWLAYLGGKEDDAVAAYRRADEIEPFNSKTHYHWALALAKVGQLPEATAHFRQVLAIDPNHAGACHGLSTALRQQGHAEEAVRFAKRAARLTKDENTDVLLALAEAYAATGRFALAVAVAGQALETAQATNPHTVPQIRWRLEEWRARAKKGPA